MGLYPLDFIEFQWEEEEGKKWLTSHLKIKIPLIFPPVSHTPFSGLSSTVEVGKKSFSRGAFLPAAEYSALSKEAKEGVCWKVPGHQPEADLGVWV